MRMEKKQIRGEALNCSLSSWIAMENPICHRDVVHPADNEIVRWSEQLRKWWLVYPGQSWHHQYSRKKVLFLCRCWKYINYSFYIDITNSWRSRKFLADVQQKKRKIFFIIILIVLALWTLVLPIFFLIYNVKWFMQNWKLNFTNGLYISLYTKYFRDKFWDCNMLCNWIISNYEGFRITGFGAQHLMPQPLGRTISEKSLFGKASTQPSDFPELPTFALSLWWPESWYYKLGFFRLCEAKTKPKKNFRG